ncbi:MAG: acylneuraminate cytidylyltransferase family protein [Rhodovibrionaceae bacterium]
MLDARRILAVVPARGGSKGLPGKNLKPLKGRPLVALAGEVAAQVAAIDRAVVSTDDEAIAAAAESAGLAAPFRRPPELSGDRIGDLEVLTHALETCEALDGVAYDIVVMLQPTSPLRRPEDVAACIEKLVTESWDAVWTVSETDSKAHPLKQLTLGAEGALGYYDEAGGRIVARQQLQPLYHRNGVAYAITRQCLVEQKTIKGSRSAGLLLEGPHVSIDTEWDLQLVEFILERRGKD